MDFEEKMDAMRMKLELAMRDMDSFRAAIRELKLAAEADRDRAREDRVDAEAGRRQVNDLLRSTQALLAAAESRERPLENPN